MTPCREFQGQRSASGYGRFMKGGKKWRVHRWVMAQVHGEEAIEGRIVMHICDNPPCFRYDHLRIATTLDNVRDKMTKDRWRNGHISGTIQPKTHCGQGHERSPENIGTGGSCKVCNRERAKRKYHENKA